MSKPTPERNLGARSAVDAFRRKLRRESKNYPASGLARQLLDGLQAWVEDYDKRAAKRPGGVGRR
jgi:hypothetical protein